MTAERDNIVRILWTEKQKWRVEEIYGKKTVAKYNVEALFLQLIASRMIELKRINNIMTWVMGRSPDPEDRRETVLNHELDNSWLYWNLIR